VDAQGRRAKAAAAVIEASDWTTRRKGGEVQGEPLKIKQTATGYWVVERGTVQLAGAMTRHAAEAERDLLNCLRVRSLKRPRAPQTAARMRLRAVRSYDRR
jgi:hypothetical protein